MGSRTRPLLAPVAAGAPVVDELTSALGASLVRLLRLRRTAADSPMETLRLATLLRSQAALLSAIAEELGGRAYEDLGRFGAEAVRAACGASDAEAAASEVADAFLGLWRPPGESVEEGRSG